MRRLFCATLAALAIISCAPTARTVTGAASPTTNAAGGPLSTTPAPGGGPSPAEAATFTAVAKLVAQPVVTGTQVPTAVAPATRGSVPTPPPASASTPTAGQVGQVIRAPNWEFLVEGTQRAKEFTWSQYGNKETARGEFVIVTLRIANVGNRNFGLNQHDFELYDGQGRKYDTASPFAFDQWLELQKRQSLCNQCPPGVTVPTGVLYDVAPGLTGLKLRIVQAKTDVALP